MIVTVTLNTAIDKTLSVPNFRLGRRHRTVEQTTMPGGKGVNVARVLKTLGAPVIDPTNGEQTEINERGPKVTEREVELFVDKLLYLAKGASVCVFAGSLP